MGPRLKLPRHVHSFLDRHGKPRFYFRRPGFKNVPLRGLPYSREFMADYEAALASHPAPVGADRTRPGTMRALALYQRCALFAVILAKSLDDGAVLGLRRWPQAPERRRGKIAERDRPHGPRHHLGRPYR